ncbi:transposase [Avibacterium sp. 21-595]|nr:transposase [Avibacterium sp. 20-129]URL06413.1 transposase [Avibacterium sp. 21-595]
MSYTYQFRLEIIKQATKQDVGIREVAKRYQISHSLVIKWLKAFHERDLEGVKSPFIQPKRVKLKMKKKEIKIPEPHRFIP